MSNVSVVSEPKFHAIFNGDVDFLVSIIGIVGWIKRFLSLSRLHGRIAKSFEISKELVFSQLSKRNVICLNLSNEKTP
jgi:hypothetical protein